MDRREFLNVMLTGAAVAGTASVLKPPPALANDPPAPGGDSPRQLAIVDRTIEVKGRSAKVFGLVRLDGLPGLVLDAGSTFDVALANSASDPTLIHWHGLTPPWPMDGVPDNPAPLLKPGETRRYTFPVGEGGTHWMHAHTLQEQKLLAAPLIVRTEEDRKRDEQEVVVLLHDFSFKAPEEILAGLRRRPETGESGWAFY